MGSSAKITKMKMDRQCSNGSYFYRGQAIVGDKTVDFTVRSRSQVYADPNGNIDYVCLDHAQNLDQNFPVKEDTLTLEGRAANGCELTEAILAEFKRQYHEKASLADCNE